MAGKRPKTDQNINLDFSFLLRPLISIPPPRARWYLDRKPYKFIGFGDIHGPKPYKFIGFGDIHGPKPYKFIGFGPPGPAPQNKSGARRAGLGPHRAGESIELRGATRGRARSIEANRGQ